MKLVTIVCEALAREPLERLLTEIGAHGYTVFPVEGQGAKGLRAGGIEEFANIQMEVIIPASTAESLLRRLQSEFFEHYTIIAFETDVQVLRAEKF